VTGSTAGSGHTALACAILSRAVKDARSRNRERAEDARDFLESDAAKRLVEALGLDGGILLRALPETAGQEQRR
jgi:hypothetical protein